MSKNCLYDVGKPCCALQQQVLEILFLFEALLTASRCHSTLRQVISSQIMSSHPSHFYSTFLPGLPPSMHIKLPWDCLSIAGALAANNQILGVITSQNACIAPDAFGSIDLLNNGSTNLEDACRLPCGGACLAGAHALATNFVGTTTSQKYNGVPGVPMFF